MGHKCQWRGLTRLTNEQVDAFAAPSLKQADPVVQIAYVTTTSHGYPPTGLMLKLLTIPTDQIKGTISIGADKWGDKMGMYNTFTAALGRGVAWSHNGRRLAYISSVNGTLPDLYVMNIDNQDTTRLTHASSIVSLLEWSPDDSYILHARFPRFAPELPYLGNYEMWAVNTMGNIDDIQIQPISATPRFYGWIGTHTVLVGAGEFGGPSTIREVDISTSTSKTVSEALLPVTTDPQQERSSLRSPSPDDCKDKHWVLIRGDGRELSLPITGCGNARFVEHANVWQVFLETGTRLVTTDGSISVIDLPFDMSQMLPVSSDDGQYWAWTGMFPADAPGLWITEGGANAKLIYDGAYIRNLTWSPDSRTVFFLADEQLFMAKAPEFDVMELSDKKAFSEYTDWDAQWVR